MSNLKKRKVSFRAEITTKKQKVQATQKGKIQKYSSSSGSESEDAIPKQKINQKTLHIRRKILKKKSDSSCLKEKNLSEGEESLKNNGGKHSANNHSSDSDEPPLRIDESGSNGSQKQMKDEVELKKSSPVKTNSHDTTSDSESEIEGTQEIVKKINYNNFMKSKRNVCKNLPVTTSGSESDSNEVEETIKTKSFNTSTSIKTKAVNETSKATTSESESDVEASQQTTQNHRNVMKKRNVCKNLPVTTSESESDSNEVEETITTKSFNTSTSIKTKEVNETSKATTSESESDVEASQQTTKNHRNVITTRAIINRRPIVSSSESKSDSDSNETLTQQKTNNSENTSKVADSKTESLKEGSNTPTSESESDSNKAEKLASTKNHDKDAKNVNNSKIEAEICSKSESESEEKQETESLEDFRRRQKTSEDMDSESDEGETKKTEKKRNEAESTVDEDEETNFDATQTVSVKAEVPENLNNPYDMPTLDFDSVMIEEIEKKDNSEDSDFELTLENGSSHGEKEASSSDTGKSQISNNKIRKTNLLEKKQHNSPKKASASVAEVEREMDNIVPENRQDQVSSDDSAEEEDLNETPVSFRPSSYQPSKEERLKLANMTIDVGYRVLRQHQVESTAGTRTMNEREREAFETITGFPIKRGKFDSSEDKILKKNWKLFCQTHGWDPKNPKPFLYMKHKNNKEFLLSLVNRKRFMQRLACGLPNRSLYSIFQRFKNLFEPHRTCRYTEDEDRVIVDFISKYNDIDQKDRKFAELATILRRTRASVWRRCRVLNKKQMLSFEENFCHSSK